MKQHYISDKLIPIISVKLGCRYVPNIPLSLCPSVPTVPLVYSVTDLLLLCP